MVCLEMIGYFSDSPDSQPNPVPELDPDVPDSGNFIAVTGLDRYRQFNEDIHPLMQENDGIDTRLIKLPANNAYAWLSDQRNYYLFGYPAVMITDTALIRNHNYHTETDTIDTLDF